MIIHKWYDLLWVPRNVFLMVEQHFCLLLVGGSQGRAVSFLRNFYVKWQKKK